MKIAKVWFLGTAFLLAAVAAECAEPQITFELPTEVEVGKQFTVKIKVTGVTAGQGLKLSADLHWNKLDGNYAGFLSWGGNPKDVTGEQTFTYKYTAKGKEGLGSVVVMAFLSTNGNFENAAKTATSEKINLKGLEEYLKEEAKKTRPDTATLKKSWISIGHNKKGEKKTEGEGWTEGDDWIVPVEYYVDPSDDWGGTKLQLWVVGPWVDCPDGKYTTKRGHHNYPGLGGIIDCKIGEKIVHEFRMKLPKTMKSKTGKVGDSLLLITFFKGFDGKNWPWQIRGSGPHFTRRDGFFEIDCEKPGNLFTYGQPVVMNATLRNVKDAGAEKVLKYSVLNTKADKVAEGEVKFKVGQDGQKIPVTLDLKERGTFLIVAEVDGWEKREITFATVPDVMKITGGEKTRFGMGHIVGSSTSADTEEEMKVARMLGLTTCRSWVNWSSVQPSKNEWRMLEDYDKGLALGKKYGIDTWMLFQGPPVWALDAPAQSFSFCAFPFRDEELRTAIDTLGKRFKGKIIGWEWLNEILPGNVSQDPVSDYMRFCKVGTEAAKKVDPTVITTLAGGLWPQSFRKSVLAAGIGKYVDVLPVHYSNGGSVSKARADLDAAGNKDVMVWDNETARGISTWDMPLVEAMQITDQGNWVMENWTDELMADCKLISYFGGQGDPAGNWTYMWDDLSPRPVVATLAVFTGKMFKAKALGGFMLGKNGVFHLFEKNDGSSLLVASSYENGGETVKIHTGSPSVTITDQQGNETPLSVSGKLAELKLDKLRYFVERGDLDVLKAYVVPEIVVSSSVGKRSNVMQAPRLSVLLGKEGKVYVKVRNLYDRALSGSLKLNTPEGWEQIEPIKFSLSKGEENNYKIPLKMSADTKPGSYDLSVLTSFDWEKLPAIDKPFALTVISPDMLGNLVKNGGFDVEGDGPDHAANWSKNDYSKRTPVSDGELGHGGYALRIADTHNSYAHVSQGRELEGGRTYLYTAWLKSKNLSGGSNINMVLKDGTQKNMYDVHVFKSTLDQDWEMLACRFTPSPELKSLALTPVAKGAGEVIYDNIRLTVFEGTDYAAECHKAKKTITVDGKLDDWDKTCPIPLMGRNQLSKIDANYKWTPQNFSGVAYLNWNDKGLYLAIEVLDNAHKATEKNEGCVNDDSVILGIHPANRVPGQDSKAFAYYISSVVPGGSGKHTIFRPEDKSGGLKTGSLAKDSSVYELAISHANGKTVYEILMPYAELGGINGDIGTKIGLSLQLNDNDGAGKAASMNWGGGLSPRWMPQDMGVVTFVE